MKRSLIYSQLNRELLRFQDETFPNLLIHLGFDLHTAGLMLKFAIREMTIWRNV